MKAKQVGKQVDGQMASARLPSQDHDVMMKSFPAAGLIQSCSSPHSRCRKSVVAGAGVNQINVGVNQIGAGVNQIAAGFVGFIRFDSFNQTNDVFVVYKNELQLQVPLHPKSQVPDSLLHLCVNKGGIV